MSEPTRPARSLDVSGLPTVVFSHRSLMWWGTLGVMAIEGTVFALAAMAYFYLRSHQDTWPLTALPPDLRWGTVNTLLMWPASSGGWREGREKPTCAPRSAGCWPAAGSDSRSPGSAGSSS